MIRIFGYLHRWQRARQRGHTPSDGARPPKLLINTEGECT
jgi:hypothetical protein